MNGEIILKAMTDIDDALINEAADDEYIISVFRGLSYEELHCEDDVRRRRNVRRIIIAAVVVALLIALAAITISGDFFNFNFPRNVLDVNGNEAIVDLLTEQGSAETYSNEMHPVVKKFRELGVDKVALPSVVLEDWTMSKDVTALNNGDTNPELLVGGSCSFEKNSMSVFIEIIKYRDIDYVPFSQITRVENGEMLVVNGLSVCVFYRGSGSCTVEYVDGTTLHTLHFSFCTYEEVVEIARTIGAPVSISDTDDEDGNGIAHSSEDESMVINIVKRQYECLKDNDVWGMTELLSKDLLLDIDYDVRGYVDDAYETVVHFYGETAVWELHNMSVEWYDARQIVFTREEYTKDENEYAGFQAPLITDVCEVMYDMHITTDNGEFTEEQLGTVLVKENGEWKIW